jgi:hypothetical protein
MQPAKDIPEPPWTLRLGLRQIGLQERPPSHRRHRSESERRPAERKDIRIVPRLATIPAALRTDIGSYPGF